MQLNQSHHTIERMRREMAQKNVIISDLAAQVTTELDSQDLVNELVEEEHEEYPARAQCTLEEATAQRDALEITAHGHKKVVTMLQAQIAALKLKTAKSDEAHKQAAAALVLEKAKNNVREGHGCWVNLYMLLEHQHAQC